MNQIEAVVVVVVGNVDCHNADCHHSSKWDTVAGTVDMDPVQVVVVVGLVGTRMDSFPFAVLKTGLEWIGRDAVAVLRCRVVPVRLPFRCLYRRICRDWCPEPD